MAKRQTIFTRAGNQISKWKTDKLNRAIAGEGIRAKKAEEKLQSKALDAAIQRQNQSHRQANKLAKNDLQAAKMQARVERMKARRTARNIAAIGNAMAKNVAAANVTRSSANVANNNALVDGNARLEKNNTATDSQEQNGKSKVNDRWGD